MEEAWEFAVVSTENTQKNDLGRRKKSQFQWIALLGMLGTVSAAVFAWHSNKISTSQFESDQLIILRAEVIDSPSRPKVYKAFDLKVDDKFIVEEIRIKHSEFIGSQEVVLSHGDQTLLLNYEEGLLQKYFNYCFFGNNTEFMFFDLSIPAYIQTTYSSEVGRFVDRSIYLIQLELMLNYDYKIGDNRFEIKGLTFLRRLKENEKPSGVLEKTWSEIYDESYLGNSFHKSNVDPDVMAQFQESAGLSPDNLVEC